jgi:hypothetical protein
MVRADMELFAALGSYWAGMAQVLGAELNDDESDAFRQAVGPFQEALERLRTVKSHEERILDVAQRIEYSAYFVRRHEVIAQDTDAFVLGLESMVQDLGEGYYPASACAELNAVLARMMGNFARDARIEGVLARVEGGESRAT